LTNRVVVGIGLSSAATTDDVRALVDEALATRGHSRQAVAMVATRTKFVADPRLDLGYPIIGIDDERLEAASAPVDRAVGIQARVAETAALLALPGAHIVGPVERSTHVTVAVAVA
jgi:cobalamin biosynthesis protein CbiG